MTFCVGLNQIVAVKLLNAFTCDAVTHRSEGYVADRIRKHRRQQRRVG